MYLFKSESKLKKMYFEKNGGLILEQWLKANNDSKSVKVIKFSSNELNAATDNFNRGRSIGGSDEGTVFKGTLLDGTQVAVKRFKIDTIVPDKDNVTSPVNEIVTLNQVDHRCIVKLLGCCLETEIPLLVYEFIPGGDLEILLRNRNTNRRLSWRIRLRIVVEIADALSCLHNSYKFPIFHRDIKSSNILLDHRHKAKLVDFGISWSAKINDPELLTSHSCMNGYVDPEYSQSRTYTAESEVYSFGMVMVELLTGRVAADMIQVVDGSTLVSLGTHFMNSDQVLEVLEPCLMESTGNRSAIEAVAALAKRCLNNLRRLRPTMAQVSEELERIRLLPIDSI